MKLTSIGFLALSSSLSAHASAVPSKPHHGGALSDYTNPVLWEDLADLDVFRVGNEYYYSASNMAFSPGAPILKSGDLVNWEYVGHSVPRLEFNNTAAYSLDGGKQAYVKGIFASSMRYRASTNTFVWIGCVEYKHTYVYEAKDPAGDWELVKFIDTCYYDCGLLIDDNDDLFVAYGNTNISVAQLNDDYSERSVTSVFNGTFYIEGSRFYHIGDQYYILTTQPANREWTLKSSSGPFGPYEIKVFADEVSPPTAGAGYPHQGGIVDTPSGDWYYMAFIDDYPEGRVPVLSPFHFNDEGWPTLPSNQTFNQSHPYPSKPVPVPPKTGIDRFKGNKLGPEWEWNHNPDVSAYSLSKRGLILRTASVTPDLFRAKNTLTHRILGPSSTATVHLDISKMQAGDRAGLALFRDNMAHIAIQDGQVQLWRNLSLGAGWNTISTGFVEASAALPRGAKDVYFRLHANVAPQSDKLGTFSWSTNGRNFQPLGTPYLMNNTYYFFVGYRFGIFNFATEKLGGSVTARSFEMAAP
ncbi:hypothetical protein LTR95_001611 [Oleoguttula sp. CCFEE 5521]